MDIQLKKKPWYVRYRLYLAGGVLLLAGLIYVIILASGPQRLRIDADSVQLAEVKQAPFREYVDVEGVVHPILTLMVNARESGNVARIVAEEGSLLQQGDTILLLTNPDLLREIDDQRDEWEKQRISYQEKALEMEQKSLTLKQQTLEAAYELNKIRKSFALEQEEYRMGIRSKAQLEVSEDEYRYKTASTQLKMQSLQSDSAMTVIRREAVAKRPGTGTEEAGAFFAADGRAGGTCTDRWATQFCEGHIRPAGGSRRESGGSKGHVAVQGACFSERILRRPGDSRSAGIRDLSGKTLCFESQQGGAGGERPHL